MAMPRILIVDDYDGFRALARRLLSLGGFEVVGEAADGHAALAAVHALRPDVVLLDVQLPGLDGFAVAGRLHAEGCKAVVVLTSSRDLNDYGPVARPGVGGFVAKAALSAEAVASAAAAAGTANTTGAGR
jgi:CheY-like chemotaxis protein